MIIGGGDLKEVIESKVHDISFSLCAINPEVVYEDACSVMCRVRCLWLRVLLHTIWETKREPPPFLGSRTRSLKEKINDLKHARAKAISV